MKNRLQKVIMIAHAVGMLVLAFSRIFLSYLSDFARGFCEGFSLTLIVIGTVYIVWCLAKKKNPYVFDDNKK